MRATDAGRDPSQDLRHVPNHANHAASQRKYPIPFESFAKKRRTHHQLWRWTGWHKVQALAYNEPLVITAIKSRDVTPLSAIIV